MSLAAWWEYRRHWWTYEGSRAKERHRTLVGGRLVSIARLRNQWRVVYPCLAKPYSPPVSYKAASLEEALHVADRAAETHGGWA